MRSLHANMDPPPAEGNFCDDSNRTVTPHIVERYNRHLDYIDNSDCMANSYLMSRHTFRWSIKFFFNLLDLSVLNSWILLSSYGAKFTQRDFRLLLVRNLIEEAAKSQYLSTPRLIGRPSAAVTHVVRLKSHHKQHWPVKPSIKLPFILQPKKGHSV